MKWKGRRGSSNVRSSTGGGKMIGGGIGGIIIAGILWLVFGVNPMTALQTGQVIAGGGSNLHPGQSAQLYIDDIYIGWLGQLHPNTAKQLDLPTTWVAQLSLAPLLTLAREQHAITTPSKFPQVRRDIAILVDSDITVQTLEATISASAGDLLTDLWLFDVYQGENVPTGQRSLAFALLWQDITQTLSDDAVKAATDKVVQALIDKHAVQLRDS